MRKFFILALFSGVLFFGSMLTKTESAEAGWDDWKSSTVECTVTRTLGFDYGLVATQSTTYEGTMRRCVNGWGLCAWNGSCG